MRDVSASFGPGQSSSIALDLGGRFGQDQALGYRFNAAYEDLNPYIKSTQGHRHLMALAMDWRLTADSRLEWEIERSERQQMGVNAYSLMGATRPEPVDGKTNLTVVFEKLKEKYKSNPLNTIDGLRIEFDNDWVHLRSSNTEPIIRIIAESNFETTANNIASKLIRDIQESL